MTISEKGSLAQAKPMSSPSMAASWAYSRSITASVPVEAETLRDAAYDLLPRTKITDVLLDVDRWTGLAECFVHQRSGRPPDNKEALLTAILADGINLG